MWSSSDMIDSLRKGEESIGVIGAGFIGTTTALFYAHEGVKSVLYDVDKAKISKYNCGECDVVNLENWSGMSLKEFVDQGMINPSHDFDSLKECRIFFVSVPTESKGEPSSEYIKSVLNDLGRLNPLLIIIESTLSPKWITELELNNKPICVAIRRDWFSNPNFTLKTIPRIYCASTPELNDLSFAVMSLVTDKLLKASSMEATSLVKAMENALWHVQLVAVQELASTYDLDVDEILSLVATHPQRVRYYPSMKVGGYCVPLGSKYVRDSADHPENLRLFTAAIEQNERTVPNLIKSFVEKTNPRIVGVLGITYKNDLKVHTLSPGMAVVNTLKSLGRTVIVNDIFYSNKEIVDVTGCSAMSYPDGLSVCDLIIVTIDHKKYYETPLWLLQKYIKTEATILDNLGVWNKYKPFLNNYYQFGKTNV